MAQLKWYSFRWKTGAIALGLGLLCWYFLMGRYMHPVGRGPAGPPVSAREFHHPWSTDKTVLLGLGDSVTDGYGATKGHAYFDLLVRNDDAGYPDMAGRDLSHVLPSLEVVNGSVSCSTSDEHLRSQVGYLRKFPKDVRGIVVITTGGNDLIHDYGRSTPRDGAMYGCTAEQASEWKESFRKRLRGIIEGVNKRFPCGCHIFLATIYDPTDGVGDIQNGFIMLPKWQDGLRAHGMFNNVIAEECERHSNVHLVDIHSAMLGHGIHCRDRRNPHYRPDDPHYWYYNNLEDPNERGYDAIRRIFLLKMIEVLEQNTGNHPSHPVGNGRRVVPWSWVRTISAPNRVTLGKLGINGRPIAGDTRDGESAVHRRRCGSGMSFSA